MLRTSQLTPAQRRIREARGRRSSDSSRIARHRVQLPRVRESIVRLPDPVNR
jgi:hypothetical protein